MTKITNHTEVTIIGGGPGGLSAAYELVNQGISVSLIDENSLLGGQFLRQLNPEFIKNKKTYYYFTKKAYIIWKIISLILFFFPKIGHGMKKNNE